MIELTPEIVRELEEKRLPYLLPQMLAAADMAESRSPEEAVTINIMPDRARELVAYISNLKVRHDKAMNLLQQARAVVAAHRELLARLKTENSDASS